METEHPIVAIRDLGLSTRKAEMFLEHGLNADAVADWLNMVRESLDHIERYSASPGLNAATALLFITYGFDIERAEDWIKHHMDNGLVARELEKAGITPEQLDRHYEDDRWRTLIHRTEDSYELPYLLIEAIKSDKLPQKYKQDDE